jgi:hypothetical protein
MTFQVTQGELAYEAGIALTGAYKVFAAARGNLTEASTLAQWEAVEIAATNGYAPITGTLGAATLNLSNGRFEVPTITGQFNATGAGYMFDTVVVKLAGRTFPYALKIYPTPVTLAAGQAQSFNIILGIKL